MTNQELKSDLLLLITAAIWGFAFVAQRIGADYVGAFTFNGVRFALGGLSLIPLLFYFSKKPQENSAPQVSAIPGGIIAGCVLFCGASLQQIGMASTTAGKAGFITGLYIVIVPIFGLLIGHRTQIWAWLGALLAVAGLYFLSVTGDLSLSKGDLIVLTGALFWATHILVIDHLSSRVEALKLSFVQFITASILCLAVALVSETITLEALRQALIPILYTGLCSTGIAYTLQTIGQKHAKPTHAAIIMSLESVFAAIGGMLLLGEVLGGRGYLGCALMLAGMLLSQMKSTSQQPNL
jgi:drug/metabolite transporter (DMT)-like permease